MVIFHSYVSLPEGKPTILGIYHFQTRNGSSGFLDNAKSWTMVPKQAKPSVGIETNDSSYIWVNYNISLT